VPNGEYLSVPLTPWHGMQIWGCQIIIFITVHSINLAAVASPATPLQYVWVHGCILVNMSERSSAPTFDCQW